MTDGNMILRQFELEDKIAGQRLEIKRLNGVLSNLIEALRFYGNTDNHVIWENTGVLSKPHSKVIDDRGDVAREALTNLDTVPLDTKRLDWIETEANWKRRNLTIDSYVPNSDPAWFEVREWDTTRHGTAVEHTIGDGMNIREAIDKAMNGGEVNHGSHSEEKEDAKPNDLRA